MDMTPTAEPQISPDGRWWWDGHAWSAITAAPPTVLPQQQGWTPSPYAAQPAERDGLGLTSLVLSILWLGGLASLAGIICGHASARRAKRAGRATHGVALAGVIIGYLGLALAALIFVSIAIPVFLDQRAAGREHVLAEAMGVPPAVEAQFGTSPYVPEQFGKTQADLAAHRRACSPALLSPHAPSALTYAAIQHDTSFEETLLSWSLNSTGQRSTPAQRAEMVRIDRKKIAAMQASPALARPAAQLIQMMRQYDAALAASTDEASWAEYVGTAHMYSDARSAAAAELRKTLGVAPASSCHVLRP